MVQFYQIRQSKCCTIRYLKVALIHGNTHITPYSESSDSSISRDCNRWLVTALSAHNLVNQPLFLIYSEGYKYIRKKGWFTKLLSVLQHHHAVTIAMAQAAEVAYMQLILAITKSP